MKSENIRSDVCSPAFIQMSFFALFIECFTVTCTGAKVPATMNKDAEQYHSFHAPVVFKVDTRSLLNRMKKMRIGG
jgi:hypothetical protein